MSFKAQEEFISISIQDYGKGIPSFILQKIGATPYLTFGKKDSSGLSVFHAKNTVEYWKGRFRIESVENQGTCVTLLMVL